MLINLLTQTIKREQSPTQIENGTKGFAGSFQSPVCHLDSCKN